MSPKAKTSLLIAVFLVVFASLAAFFILPIFQEIEKYSTEILSQKQGLSALEFKINNLEKFEKNLEELKGGLDKGKNVLVDASLPIDFIRFLEGITKDSGLVIKISPPVIEQVEGDPWSSSLFQIDLTGPFPNFLKFLDKLETSNYLIQVKILAVDALTEAEPKKELEKLPLASVQAGLAIKVYSK